MNTKKACRNWLYRVVAFVILFCSVISCIKAFDNHVEYNLYEKIDEMQLVLDDLWHQVDSMEIPMCNHLFDGEQREIDKRGVEACIPDLWASHTLPLLFSSQNPQGPLPGRPGPGTKRRTPGWSDGFSGP